MSTLKPLNLALAVAITAAWGLNFVVIRIGVDVIPPLMLSLMVWASVIPPLPLIGMSLLFEWLDASLTALADLGLQQIGAVLYLAYVAILFGFGGWAMLIARHGAGRIAPFSLLVPVFGMVSSTLILGETYAASQLLAAGLIIAGLALSLWTPGGKVPSPVPHLGAERGGANRIRQ